AQMINFPVAGGTSGHLLGAALATILLGPWAAVLVMTCVVGGQALIFQDGGLLVLGANLFNMAVIGVTVSYGVNRLFRRLLGEGKRGIFVAGFVAAWASIFIAALAAALQLALSGTSPASLAVPAMAGIHALIGIGEGLITLGALAFLYAARRDLLHIGEPQPRSNTPIWVGGAIIFVVLAVLSPLASSHPDGLESVAHRLGFIEQAKTPAFSLISNYSIPGVSNAALATILAGLFGALIVLAAVLLLGWSRRRRSNNR
ncbi:cobalamin biosynthesis protein CbiM, partial [bacterium]|nr:cobalamin biosynthesis protein CbiM [bacterium]